MPDTTQQPWEHRRWRDGVCRPELGSQVIMPWVMALLFGGALTGIAVVDCIRKQYDRVVIGGGRSARVFEVHCY